jgi:PAS domain S-box-containing protein
MNEERLRQALDVAGVGVFDHDHRTGDIWWSTRMRTILGVGDEPSRSTIDRYLAVVHPDDRGAVTAAIREAHESDGDGQFDVEHRLCRPDGQVRWVSLHARTSFHGSGCARQPERTVGTILDITERKQAEASAHG